MDTNRSISLARWENQQGSSSGWWLIREIPGLCIYSTFPGKAPWRLRDLDEDWAIEEDGLPEAIAKIWGVSPEDYNFSPARGLLRANPQLEDRNFASRSEAVSQIECALGARRGPGTLGEAL